MSVRLASVSTNLRKHAEARAMTSSPVWADLWNDLEQELLERLLTCGPTDDEKRFRLQTAISVARDLRRMVEVKGITPPHLEKELAILEGAKASPIA